jgi:hypothetical protein
MKLEYATPAVPKRRKWLWLQIALLALFGIAVLGIFIPAQDRTRPAKPTTQTVKRNSN